MFFIAKGCVPLFICDNTWFQHLVLQFDLNVDFPSQRSLVRKHILLSLLKIMEEYVLPTLVTYVIVSVTFDLWMSKPNFDTFAVVVNFVNNNLVPQHITIDLFESLNTFGTTLVEIMKPILIHFQLLTRC